MIHMETNLVVSLTDLETVLPKITTLFMFETVVAVILALLIMEFMETIVFIIKQKLQERLDRENGIRYCSNCCSELGTDVDRDELYCYICGHCEDTI
jgi:hypothetical protein